MPEMNITLSEPNISKLIDLNLYDFGQEACQASHSWGPAVRDHYIIHYIHSGKGIFKVADKVFHLTKGQGFLICPHTIVYYKADELEPWNYSWVGFCGLQAQTYLERANLTFESPIFEIADDQWFEKMIARLTEALQTEKSSDLLLQSILFRFFSELIHLATTSKAQQRTYSSREMHIKKAIDYIQVNYSRKISVLDIANVVGLDRTYLSSLFKSKLDLSLQLFLVQFRINKACELMEHSELTIGDISRSVGYNDPLLFSKMFKKIKNVSPKKYRELHNRRKLDSVM